MAQAWAHDAVVISETRDLVIHEPAGLLLALQFGDSAFPSGGFAFSWGLEGLAADGLVETDADMAAFIAEQLTRRWNSMDRVLLRQAYRAAGPDAAITADRLAEAATLSAPMRAGSRRAGRALLGVCARLGLPDAIDYREIVNTDDCLGHLSVVQGIVFRAAGLPLNVAEVLSGWAVISGLSSAAIRLGLIGHVAALEMAGSLRTMLAGLLNPTLPISDTVSSFTPLADIAIMRNAGRGIRMFAT